MCHHIPQIFPEHIDGFSVIGYEFKIQTL